MNGCRNRILAVFVLMLALPGAAFANARLRTVTPVDGGCVAGPTGPNVEAWDVQPGMTYTVMLDHVFDAGHSGTDPTIGILLMSTSLGNIRLTASLVVTGVYRFTVTIPPAGCATMPVRYGVVNGMPSTGLVAGRHDDGTAQSHLRASTFGSNCSNPVPILCASTPAVPTTWGTLKSLYR